MIKESLKASALQHDIVWGDPASNLKAVDKELSALPGDVDIIVLPEMFSTGFLCDKDAACRLAEPMDGTTMEMVRKWSRQYDADMRKLHRPRQRPYIQPCILHHSVRRGNILRQAPSVHHEWRGLCLHARLKRDARSDLQRMECGLCRLLRPPLPGVAPQPGQSLRPPYRNGQLARLARLRLGAAAHSKGHRKSSLCHRMQPLGFRQIRSLLRHISHNRTERP